MTESSVDEREAGLDPALDPKAVARKLASLPAAAMRAAALGEIVRAHTPSATAWLLDGLATAGRGGGPPFDLGLLAAVDLFSRDDIGLELRRDIAEAAQRHGLAACRELVGCDVETLDATTSTPRPLVPGSRPLTLGERKSLARSWRRDVLERLIVDPHVDVVEKLLDNPHITERDVLQIATSRHSSAQVLLCILHAPRWSCRPGVRRALVRNPRLPLDHALRLLGLLNRSELREIAGDPHLPLRLAAALHRRLAPVS